MQLNICTDVQRFETYRSSSDILALDAQILEKFLTSQHQQAQLNLKKIVKRFGKCISEQHEGRIQEGGFCLYGV